MDVPISFGRRMTGESRLWIGTDDHRFALCNRRCFSGLSGGNLIKCGVICLDWNDLPTPSR